jgi:RHS repeat-associated protein
VVERRFYGEGVAGDKALNLRGQVAVRYDTSGKTENLSFDFQGNLTGSARRFAAAYRDLPNWSGATPDARLDAESFASSSAYDARDRVTERATPDGSVYQPRYNEAGLLETVSVTQAGATRLYVKNIDYDEQGRRQRVVFGNDVSVTYRYDHETRRLLGLTSRTLGGQALQDFHYTYDPIGNLTHLEDRCVPTVWFGNSMVSGLATYRYDALYRLIEATGREHPGQLAAGAADNWDDQPFLHRYAASDPLVWRNYTQSYTYDEVGNLSQMKHVAPLGGNWTRDYQLAADRNRLVSTQSGATVFPYSHQPAHGYMTAMPHLSVMRSNFRDELQAVATQKVASGSPETTWYVYDADGQRVRKVTDRSAAVGDDPVKKSERYYLDGVEIYREYAGGGTPRSERRTFHVMDDRQRVALIERQTLSTDGPPDPRLVRYQGPDHLGSSRLETDEAAHVISYEEFHPFGTTAYQAVDKGVIAAAKRYRYTEMERDEESGLEYHGARYYVPWLGRWTAPDKHPDQVTGNRYAYVKNNPVIHSDPNGMSEEPLHGATTFRLLVAAGFTPADAARIALADAAMDHDPEDTAGAGDAVDHPDRVRQGHFDPEHAVSRIEADIAGFGGHGETHPEPGKLEAFGRNLHNAEDVGFPGAPGPHTRGTKELSSDIIAISAWAGALGGVLLGVSQASGVSSDAQTGLIIAAFILIVAAQVGLGIGLSLLGIGHGTYTSEVGETSGWMPPGKYVNDQAYQDPVGNTALLQREYELMKRAAVAYYGGPRPTDDAAAGRAIYEVTHADTSERISAVLNAPVDAAGTSYMSILPGRSTVTRPGQGPWVNPGVTRGVDVGPFSDATRDRVRARGETTGKDFVYIPGATWRWGYGR